MPRRLFIALFIALNAAFYVSAAHAQSAPSSSVSLSAPRNCAMSLDGISSATAGDYGFRRTAGGYALDYEAMASRAGGPGSLLTAVREQLRANMDWFRAMETIVADPSTPMLAHVQLLYQQGIETHEVNLALARALECQLGIDSGPPQRPKTAAALQAAHETSVAQARAADVARARSVADSESSWNSQSIWNALGTIANVVGAVGSTMAGMQQNSSSPSPSSYRQGQGSNTCTRDRYLIPGAPGCGVQ